MQLGSRGQLTVPLAVREHLGLHEGDEVQFIIQGDSVRIVRAGTVISHGGFVAERLRGRGSSGMSTDEIMDLLRGDV